jgi:hypothetical protein
MAKLVITVLMTVLAITLVLPFTNAVETSNTLQVSTNAKGQFNIDCFSVYYTSGTSTNASFSLSFDTGSEISPEINVEIPYDKSQYEKDNPIFNSAELIIYGSTFVNNGVWDERTFGFDKCYHSFISPTINNNPWGPSSVSIICNYSFNLYPYLMEAKNCLGQLYNQPYALQTNLRCQIHFDVNNLAQGISSSGQQRQLRLDMLSKTTAVRMSSFHFVIPDNYYFINTQTWNGNEMYITPSSASWTETNNYRLDSNGNIFSSSEAIINWQTPVETPLWLTEPYYSVITILIGIFLSGILALIWRWIKRPRISVSLQNPWIHNQTGLAFYRLNIINKGRDTAQDCNVQLSFKDHAGQQLFLLNGKWDSLPEPYGPLLQNGQAQIWLPLIPLSEKLNLKHRRAESVCIVLKDRNPQCFAYNAESYLYQNLKNPQWQLAQGDYEVFVKITADNARKTCIIRLTNYSNAPSGLRLTII